MRAKVRAACSLSRNTQLARTAPAAREPSMRHAKGKPIAVSNLIGKARLGMTAALRAGGCSEASTFNGVVMERMNRLFLWLIVIGPLHMAEQMLTSIEEFYMLRGKLDGYYA